MGDGGAGAGDAHHSRLVVILAHIHGRAVPILLYSDQTVLLQVLLDRNRVELGGHPRARVRQPELMAELVRIDAVKVSVERTADARDEDVAVPVRRLAVIGRAR